MVPANPRVTRRRFLSAGAVALAGVACTGRGAPSTAPATATGRSLSPVRVSWDRITRRVVGLRPYRAPGFLVEAEALGESLVVHDYGHGGGGITLSWGTAHLAVEIAEREGRARAGDPPRGAVLGCGVVGLSTARLLQRRGWQVRIYTRDLPPATTSNVAGGQWTPASVYDPDVATPAFIDQFTRASRLAYREYQDYVGDAYGVGWADNYYLRDEPSPPPGPHDLSTLLPDIFASFTELGPGEHPFARSYAGRVPTMMIEPAIYLRALLRDVRIAGAEIVVRELRTPRDVAALPERVVMNCTGLGSRDLFGDEALMPVKGQLTILRPQPEVDYLLLSDGLYMFPRSDGILLGGTFERGHWDLSVDEEAEARIVEGHRQLFAAMSGPRST